MLLALKEDAFKKMLSDSLSLYCPHHFPSLHIGAPIMLSKLTFSEIAQALAVCSAMYKEQWKLSEETSFQKPAHTQSGGDNEHVWNNERVRGDRI